jgi:hypothetical protein
MSSMVVQPFRHFFFSVRYSMAPCINIYKVIAPSRAGKNEYNCQLSKMPSRKMIIMKNTCRRRLESRTLLLMKRILKYNLQYKPDSGSVRGPASCLKAFEPAVVTLRYVPTAFLSCPVVYFSGTTQDDTIIRLRKMKSSKCLRGKESISTGPFKNRNVRVILSRCQINLSGLEIYLLHRIEG